MILTMKLSHHKMQIRCSIPGVYSAGTVDRGASLNFRLGMGEGVKVLYTPIMVSCSGIDMEILDSCSMLRV